MTSTTSSTHEHNNHKNEIKISHRRVKGILDLDTDVQPTKIIMNSFTS